MGSDRGCIIWFFFYGGRGGGAKWGVRAEGNRGRAAGGDTASTQGTGSTHELHGHQDRGQRGGSEGGDEPTGLGVLRRLCTWRRCNDDEKAMPARRHGGTETHSPPTSHLAPPTPPPAPRARTHGRPRRPGRTVRHMWCGTETRREVRVG